MFQRTYEMKEREKREREAYIKEGRKEGGSVWRKERNEEERKGEKEGERERENIKKGRNCIFCEGEMEGVCSGTKPSPYTLKYQQWFQLFTYEWVLTAPNIH